MTAINSKATAEKRAVESEVHTMHAEIDDMLLQAKNAEEKAKKAMLDASRLADELRTEQDHVNSKEKSKRAMETQLSEIEVKCQEATDIASRNGKAAMAKLESRIRELEMELGSIQARTSENMKTYQKQIEEAEEIAAINLAKFRKAQQELEETEE